MALIFVSLSTEPYCLPAHTPNLSCCDMKEQHVLTFEEPSGTHCPCFYSNCYQAPFLRKHAPLKVPWVSAASSQAQLFAPFHFDVSTSNWIHSFCMKMEQVLSRWPASPCECKPVDYRGWGLYGSHV